MHDYFAEYKYSPYRSDDGELLVAVLFEDGPGTWKWKGLYQWPNATTFPKMTEQDLIIV
jgi:hypothetical protein